LLKQEQYQEIVTIVRRLIPNVRVIYLFGSLITPHARPGSDLDIAILIGVKPNPEIALALKAELGALVKRDVDIVDIMRADTVTKAQIVTGSETLYSADAAYSGFFETDVLSQYALLNEERQGIIDDIIARGSVHG